LRLLITGIFPDRKDTVGGNIYKGIINLKISAEGVAFQNYSAIFFRPLYPVIMRDWDFNFNWVKILLHKKFGL